MSIQRKAKHGFTLLEILIVIAILGVLAILITTTVTAQLKKVRDGRRKIDFNNIQKSLEQYYDSAECYPATLPACGQGLVHRTATYLASIPCDPKSTTSYVYIANGGLCSPWFTLYTNLERTDDISIDLAGCRYGCGPQCQYNFGISSPNASLERCTGPTPTPAPTGIPTPTPIQYVCAPASGPQPLGRCEDYAVPTLSECPKIYPDDPTCKNECGNKDNRCQNAKGKYKPSP